MHSIHQLIIGPVQAQMMAWCLTLYVLNFSEQTKIYIYILLFIHIDMTQVFEILPEVRQELSCSKSISWVLMFFDERGQGNSNHDIDLVKPR